jgi:endonuclease YncB( thermonuclease family)
VVGIVDGDTLTVLDAQQRRVRIRLATLDAPERKQAWGQRARQYLASRTWRKTVEVTPLQHDRYGRLIAIVRLPCQPADCQGEDVGLAILNTGMAWFSRRYAHDRTDRDQRLYAAAERAARAARQGLWQDPHPIPPWRWRYANPAATGTLSP